MARRRRVVWRGDPRDRCPVVEPKHELKSHRNIAPAALDDPDVRSKFQANGAFVKHMTPEEVTAFVQSEQTTWRPILEQVNPGLDAIHHEDPDGRTTSPRFIGRRSST